MSTDRISLAYWFPKLQATGVLVPETEWWTTDADLWTVIDGEPNNGARAFLADLKQRASRRDYPLFLRTGHTSAKHSWKDSCYVASEDQLGKSVFGLLEYSAMAMPSLPFDTWVIREFLDLDVRFKAFWGEMPINVERRYFIKDGKLLCFHPYWPAEAFERTSNKPDNWRELLEKMNEEGDEIPELVHLSIKVAGAFEGAWSLDWAKHSNSDWYAIDMAPMEVSYHWEGCPSTAE